MDMEELVCLELQIDAARDELHQSMGSVFHGALMELTDTRYAEYLHTMNVRPYSQYLYYDEIRQGWFWRLASMDQDALMMLLAPAADLEKIYIRHKHQNYPIIGKEVLAQTSFEELLEQKKEAKEFLKLRFISPTGFKSNGQYVIYPTPRLIFGSLVNKWNAFANVDLDSDNLMGKLADLRITQYNLQLRKFGLEGVWVPSFKGEVEFLLPKDKELAEIVQTLAMFANFSGTGIKTSLGMGGIIEV